MIHERDRQTDRPTDTGKNAKNRYFSPAGTVFPLMQLVITRHNLSFGPSAFRFSAPRTWNSLALRIRESQSLPAFECHPKTNWLAYDWVAMGWDKQLIPPHSDPISRLTVSSKLIPTILQRILTSALYKYFTYLFNNCQFNKKLSCRRQDAHALCR